MKLHTHDSYDAHGHMIGEYYDVDEVNEYLAEVEKKLEGIIRRLENEIASLN